MKNEQLEGTFLKDFSKRELALTLLSARNYLTDTTNISEILTSVSVDDTELDDLRQKLSDFFENF